MAAESLQVRRRPTRGKRGNLQRDSNLVRASVLETALELGFGHNSAVADWIFNNPLSEEAEDLHFEQDNHELDAKLEPPSYVVGAITPTLTSGSNSTSDESSSLNSPANHATNAAITTIQVHSHKPSVTETPYVHFDDFSSDQLQLFSPFTLSPHDAHHAGSSGGLVGQHPRDTERSRSQDDCLRHNPSQESAIPGPTDTGYTSEGQYLSKSKASKGKGKPVKSKVKKGSSSKALDTKTDGDYTSDGGYLSASSNKSLGKSPGRVKSRAMAFFRRRPKKSARGSDEEDEDIVPPVPAIPVLPRPSSPKPLERRAAPSSPTRSGFSPLTLNLTSPPASPSRRRVSKSPPPAHARAPVPQQSDQVSVPQRPVSPLVASASAATLSIPGSSAATIPLPPSMPGTPLSSASFPTSSSPSAYHAGTSKSLTASTSRQHLSIPPPAPPPTLPLPQLPPSPSISPVGTLHPSSATSTTFSRKGPATRSIPVMPTTPGPTRPLAPRGAGSPFRPLLSPRAFPPVLSHARIGETHNVLEDDQLSGKEAGGRQRSGTASSTPAFLQRKMQAPSPRPPPDVPLPPSPCPSPSTRPRTPIGTPSKFHEHFSSVSSVPLPQVLSTPKSLSPSPSSATLSGSSSVPSVRSSHISSISERSEEPVVRDRLNVEGYSRPTTSASTISESSYGLPTSSTFGRSFGRSAMNLKSRFSDRSDINCSVYSVAMHQDNGSVTTFDDDIVDIDDAAPKSCADDDDDASVYPSDDMTAGRRTMYLMEHGELGDNEDVVIAGNQYWGGHEMPPVPPLPPMPIRPGPGYF